MIDRFGVLPEPVLDLFDTIRLRENGKKLGLERIVLKEGLMRVYFISQQDHPYFQSEIFNSILEYVKNHPALCRLKQGDKGLVLTIQGINSVKQAWLRTEDLFPTPILSDNSSISPI
jgi:transcription-repair coupling factor (superfamily II helicase)